MGIHGDSLVEEIAFSVTSNRHWRYFRIEYHDDDDGHPLFETPLWLPPDCDPEVIEAYINAAIEPNEPNDIPNAPQD